jgi:hypothetical protein
MSDVQSTNQTASESTNNDSNLGLRRLIAAVIAFTLAAVVVAAGIILYLKTGLNATFPISDREVPLWPLATLPMGLFFLIWLDYFMNTKIVVD